MRLLYGAACAAALLAAGPATAADLVFKPIDTERLVVQPSRIAAGLAAQTIKLAGATTAGAAEGNGWVKTINNVFGFRKRLFTPTQPGTNIPHPAMYQSTQYKSFNTPLAPIMDPRGR